VGLSNLQAACLFYINRLSPPGRRRKAKFGNHLARSSLVWLSQKETVAY
jgi:hypothetical protein